MNLVFDLDDTLYDLSEPFRLAHKDLFAEQLGEDCEALFRMSRIYSDELLTLEKAGKIPSEDAFFLRIKRTYADAGLDISRETGDTFEARYRYHVKHITVPEGIKKVLDYCIEAGHSISILSNGKVKGQTVKLKALDLYHWFDEKNIFISETTGYHKPSLGAFQYVHEHLGVKPEQIWYVGDTYEADVIGGKRAGWNVIWYNHRHRDPDDGKNIADITVNTADELLEILQKM